MNGRILSGNYFFEYICQKPDYKFHMKKFLAPIILFAIAILGAHAQETLHYRVMFKWGLVNKQAGTVRLTTSATKQDGSVDALLTAASARWADPFYRVRDTLAGVLDAKTFIPRRYEKISHEGGHFKHDLLTYSRDCSGTTTASCHRIDQPKQKGPQTASDITLEADGMVLDMLSSYYYMRSLPFQSMKEGDIRVVTVFSGSRKETLTISYDGTADVEIDGNRLPAYAITFRFTGKGGKKTSDDMKAWISTDASRIPLKLTGKLPVGEVQCFYIPPK